ncbi:MBL fold hydrolase [Halobacteriales archaeon QS_4_70_19]|nr:MAG: MBL fold hydrolase [Halobacteriales archaeon QS_4_70_19]
MDCTRVPLQVATRAPTGRTAAYCLGTDEALLVDPAAGSDALDDVLADRTVAHVALTHHHPDHAGAVAHYAETHDATVWCRYGRRADFEAATGIAPDRTFVDGTTIPTAGRDVTVIDLPGHAPEHVGFRFADGETGAAPGDGYLVGDLAVAAGSVVVGAPEGDMRAYVSSLRRLWARDPDTLYPAHGPVIDDPRGACSRLIDHRRDREGRVRDAVHGGARTVAEITDAAYEKDLSGVRDMAEATVVAHLEKLSVEGRVRWDGAEAAPG